MTRATSAARNVLATGSCNLISTDPIMAGGWCLKWMGCPHLRHLSMLSNHVGKMHSARREVEQVVEECSLGISGIP